MTQTARESGHRRDGDGPADSTRGQIRGSTLLMTGRGISVTLNFVTQVLIVRHLSKLDYGAFAYALAMVEIGATLCGLGLDKAVAKLAPQYHERRQFGKLLGTIGLTAATIVTAGLALIAIVHGTQGLIGGTLVSSPLSLALLLSLIALAPVNALDKWVRSLFAVFSNPRAIFFRRHIVGPGLKLLAVLVVIARHGDVRMLALTYLAAGFVGLLIGLALLAFILRSSGLSPSRARLEVSPAEIFGFSLPMLNSDLIFALRGPMAILFLELFHGSTSVAALRSVLPVAVLNAMVLESFGLLFMPAMARMQARGSWDGINALHSRAAMWITVLTFPIFAVSCCLAAPLTLLLFGERYAGSSTILAILAVAHFFNASFGVNPLTLKVCGKVRHVLGLDTVATVVALLLNLSLIPRYGALGGALSLLGTMLAQALLYHVVLQATTGITMFSRDWARVSALVATLILALLAVQRLFSPPLVVGLLLVALGWLLLLRVSRRALEMESTFPELLRLPWVPRLLGVTATPVTNVAAASPAAPDLARSRRPVRNILVVGMARSGTSLTTSVLARRGYHVGSIDNPRLREGDDNNPFGYFEADALIERNVTLLRRAGFSHHNTWLYEPITDDAVARIRDLEPSASDREFVAEYASRSPWIWKDPRLCFTLPFWWKLLDPRATGVVLILREPLEIQRSFVRRGWCAAGSPEADAVLERAAQHAAAARSATEDLGIPHLVIDYRDYREQPEVVAERLGDFCGASLSVEDLNFRPELDHSTGRGMLATWIRVQLLRLPAGLRRRLRPFVPRLLLGLLLPERRHVPEAGSRKRRR